MCIDTTNKSPTEIQRAICAAKYARRQNQPASTVKNRVDDHAPLTPDEELKAMRKLEFVP